MSGHKSHYLNLFVKDVPPNIIARIIDREMKRISKPQVLNPPFLAVTSAVPECFAPHVDVTRAKVAFGRLAIPKLLREFHDPDNLVVRQALNSLSDMVFDPEKTFEAVKLNVIARLTDLMASEDIFIRDRCCCILMIIADQAAGREAIIKNDKAVDQLVKLMSDPEFCVRFKACLTVQIIAMYWEYADELNKKWFVQILLEHLENEIELDIVKIHLRTLLSLLERGHKKEAVELGGMNVLEQLIENPMEGIRHYAIACLASLLFHPSGLALAIDMDLVLQLKDRLYDSSKRVISKAAACISFIAVPTKPKLQISELGITDHLLELAADFPNEELQINAVKVLTNIAETPKGRMYLTDKLSFIEGITTGDSEKLERHIDTLLKVIKWKP